MGMIEKLTYIELGDGSYPIKCDLAVLEAAQEEYGTLNEFERKLAGFKEEKGKDGSIRTEPSIKAVRLALTWMLNEGIDIENAKEGGKRKHITDLQMKELLTDANVFEVADKLHKEFSRCFVSKNRKSTQGGEKKSD